jgi:hypothetical protein
MPRRILAMMLVLTALLAARAQARKKDEPPPPPGCHWQAIEIIGAHLAVPDGWQYRDTSEGPLLSYEVRPAGAGFENPKSLYRMEVRRGLKKADVVPRAREFVEKARATATDAPPIDQREAGHLTLFACAVVYAPEHPGASSLSSALSAAANTETGTLYMVRLDIPSDEVDRVSPLADKLFQTIRLDAGF